MPREWSAKRERQYKHIKDQVEDRGESEKRAEEIAARTVNKERARKGESKTSSRLSKSDTSSGHRGGKRSGSSGPRGRTKEQLYNEASKKARRGRLYLDVQRNGYAQTAVAPYAVRALPGAPVATPLAGAELDERGAHPRRRTVANIAERLEDDDPWAGALDHGHSVAGAAKRLRALRPSITHP